MFQSTLWLVYPQDSNNVGGEGQFNYFVSCSATVRCVVVTSAKGHRDRDVSHQHSSVTIINQPAAARSACDWDITREHNDVDQRRKMSGDRLCVESADNLALTWSSVGRYQIATAAVSPSSLARDGSSTTVPLADQPVET